MRQTPDTRVEGVRKCRLGVANTGHCRVKISREETKKCFEILLTPEINKSGAQNKIKGLHSQTTPDLTQREVYNFTF